MLGAHENGGAMEDSLERSGERRGKRAEMGAQRILNLLFALNTARPPLTTDQIIADSDLGYGSGNLESDRRKFRRDREALEAQGIFIAEVHPEGAPENEASAWEIDRKRTDAAEESLRPGDAETLVAALDDYLGQPVAIPFRTALARVRARIAEATGLVAGGNSIVPKGSTAAGDYADGEPEPDPILETVWSARVLRRALPFTYRDAKGVSSRRTVEVYGLFTMQGQCYFVGRDLELDDIRTFRADRVLRAGRPREGYEIPTGFDIGDYLFLPFDFAEGEGVEASFSFPPEMGDAEIFAITRKRGSLCRDETGRAIWSVRVKSLDAAASFALAGASRGMRPLAPGRLIACWNELIEKTVGQDGRK